VLGVLLFGALIAMCSAPALASSTWSWPVEPAEVVHGFDPPDAPWASGHRGVDLAAAAGQTVHAPAAGTVTFTGVIAGRGVVVVSHGELRTTYEPVAGSVTVGAPVEAGDVLGTLQSFAYHCSAPCLHWGAIRGETYLDPTSLVVAAPSRLLPMWGDAGTRESYRAVLEASTATDVKPRPPVAPWHTVPAGETDRPVATDGGESPAPLAVGAVAASGALLSARLALRLVRGG